MKTKTKLSTSLLFSKDDKQENEEQEEEKEEPEQEKDEHRHDLSIEYCTGCRWMFRSAWMAQELLTTFQDELDSVTLVPSRPPKPGGIFTVELNGRVLWDRKADGGFPESKQLKQRVRDIVAPQKNLGHSDRYDDNDDNDNNQDSGKEEKGRESSSYSSSYSSSSTELPPAAAAASSAAATTTTTKTARKEDCDDCRDPPLPTSSQETMVTTLTQMPTPPQPNVEIKYCTGCRWLLRSSWMAQEFLTTFPEELHSVTLTPSRPPKDPGGTLIITLDREGVLWDRKERGRFPELKEAKRLLRDRIDPDRDLGHSDVDIIVKTDPVDDEAAASGEDEDDGPSLSSPGMDEEEAAEMRKYFGVM